MMRLVLALAAAVALFAPIPACDSAGGPVGPVGAGEVTLGAENGVNLATATFVDKGNYANSDLRATDNGDALGLLPGGDSPAKYRPCNWFLSGGGIYQTFGSFAEVPETLPDAGALATALVKAKKGNGFVCQTAAGGWSRGWIKAADATSLTIVFQRVELATP